MVVQFIEDFKEEYGREPDAFNALGYDLAMFVVDGLKRAGKVDREALKDALASQRILRALPVPSALMRIITR